ncbi:MAG: hypothetical protein ACLR94_17075 [Acutalibacteraceae bacterium]
MNQQLFRKSSIDRVSSPEQLNDYIRVTSPGVWLVLAAVIVLLMGACVWGIFGRLETKITVPVQVAGGEARLVLEDGQQVDPDAPVVIGGRKFSLGTAEGVGAYSISVDLPDGEYQAEIVTESVAPMSFVFN